MKKRIAIVDPFFSGGHFRYVAEELGYEVIAIESYIKENPIHIPDPFPYYFVFNNNLTELLHELRKLDVKAVFAGCENGVMLADQLSEQLGLVTNGTALSNARRDKAEMKRVFKQQGIACAEFKELLNPSLNSIYEWMRDTGQSFPIVLKPAMGFGSISVFICLNEEEVKQALEKLKIQDLSPYGIDAKKILVEEFIDGQEYCINILGNGHTHFVTDVWKYDRREYIPGRIAYYSIDILDPNENPTFFNKLITPCLEAVKALQISYGCAHVEIKITSKQEAKVIEVAARVAGTNMAGLAKDVTGQNIELAHIQSFLGQTPVLADIYTLNGYSIIAVLRSALSGKVKTINGIDLIKNLPSFKYINLKNKPEDFIVQTVDLVTASGLVALQSQNKKQVDLDRDSCHQLFNFSFY